MPYRNSIKKAQILPRVNLPYLAEINNFNSNEAYLKLLLSNINSPRRNSNSQHLPKKSREKQKIDLLPDVDNNNISSIKPPTL
jgi:hypothetical protein